MFISQTLFNECLIVNLRGVAREDARVCGSEAGGRHADRSGDAVRAGEERQQNIATNSLKSLLENQRQAR